MSISQNRSLKRRKKMEGLKLAAQYSYVCERARLLRVSEILKNFFQNNAGEAKKIESILRGLASFNFYREIAYLNKKNFFDEEFDKGVISFYWKGSPKLKGWRWIHNSSTLIPIIQLKMHHIIPEMVDDCLINPAQVVEKSFDDWYWVKYRPIIKTKEGLEINKEKEIKVRNELRLALQKGDWVTIHLRRIIEKIKKDEAKRLLKLTKKILKRFNKFNKKNKKTEKVR